MWGNDYDASTYAWAAANDAKDAAEDNRKALENIEKHIAAVYIRLQQLEDRVNKLEGTDEKDG